MKKQRKYYDREFNLMAVQLCHAGKPAAEVGRELGINPNLVRRWKREFAQYQEGSFSGHGHPNMTAEQKEIARLKKELREAQIERDILKKAVGIDPAYASGSSRGNSKSTNS